MLCMRQVILFNFSISIFMFNKKTITKSVVVFRQYNGKSYSAFNSIGKEIRIGVLAVSTLFMAHNECLATRSDALSIVRDSVGSTDIGLGETVITGSQLPVTSSEAWSKVVVITRQEIENAKCQTINDVLKICPEIDVRQRGAFGVQTDISLGGGTFDQITILLNGININNPQTGHLSADFPVSPSDIERIEVLNGASARTFGSQSLNGIINIITRNATTSGATVHAEGGSHGIAGGGGKVDLASKKTSNSLSTDYFRTDGAVTNSDFNRKRLFYSGRYADGFIKVNWQAGYSDQSYGANTFYSAKYPNQWEEGQRYMAAVSGENRMGAIKLSPSVSFVRNYDHFQLIKSSRTGENFHRTDVTSARLCGSGSWLLGQTAFGLELRHEGILSTNLGKPLDENQYVGIEHKSGRYYDHRDNRTNMSCFLEHAVRLGAFSANIGVMTNRNTAVDEDYCFYPGVDISYSLSPAFKFYASWNKSMRMPTFTELYYKSPTQQGNVGLKPEKTSTFKLAMDYKNKWLFLNVSGIYRRGTNMIDWVMYDAEDIYHSTAFKLSNWQMVTTAGLNFKKLISSRQIFNSLKVSYVYNHQRRHDNVEIYQSNYALDYLRHKITASLDHEIWGALGATWHVRWQERMGSYLSYAGTTPVKCNYKPYTLIDLKLHYTKPRYELYASLENLLSRRYYDYGSIPQPGFGFVVGANYKFNF